MQLYKKSKTYLLGILFCVLLSIVLQNNIRNTHLEDIAYRTESKLDFFMEKEKIEKNIRVLIRSTNYLSEAHPSVRLSAPSGLLICYENTEEKWEKSDCLTFLPDDKRFAKSSVQIRPINAKDQICVESIERGYGEPTYSGMMELITTAEGIALINELSVEQYLCKVVPSEMPANYELEALKAQAVCARSYAYKQMQNYGYPEYQAHVDDSTKYQVYNNRPEQEKSSLAVRETEGEMVWYKGGVATTYFYSTSCGKTTDVTAWGTKRNEKNGYLKSVNISNKKGDYEKELPWYRWKAIIDADTISNLIGLNTRVDVGRVQKIEVTRRGSGSVALEVTITGDKNTVVVETENKIRSALGGYGYYIERNDGTTVESAALLPSAFFEIKKEGDAFVIEGGGYGHGIGMSQNGANEMAKEGRDYKAILNMFYSDIMVK